MDEVKSITSNQFIQSVKGRVVEDIIWQVAAQVISGIVGLVTQTGTIGYMLTYGLLNAIRAFDQDKQERRHIKAMTLYNDNYEGEITLSDKKAADNLWGGTLTNILGGSTAGVYAPVYTETEKHLFKGQVMLAPKGVRKTRNAGIENVPISLDYASQTRGYLSYSDFDDQRLVDYFFTDGPLSTSVPKDDDYSHMLNSITFVEDAMSQNTNGDYNTIFPYIQYGQSTFTPTLQVAGPETNHPIPEFYRDYPIFIDYEYYTGTELENEFHTIYKIYEAKHNGISIIPVNTDNDFNKTSAKVDHIDIYLLDSEGLEVFIGTFYLDSGDYTYREDYNIIYLSDTLFEALQLTLDVLNDKYSGVSNYDAYYIIEVKIEKYRSTNNLQGGLTQDDVDRIATMQAVEQSILEYTYQYQHAVDQQKGLSEMFYTIFVTSISTIVTIPFSMGLGALAKSLSKETAETALEAGTQVATQAATSATTNLATKIALTSLKMAGFFIYSAAKESLQEILLDPFIETIVADVVADVGGNVFAQVLISSLAEGAREGISGPISTLLYGKAQTNAQSYFQTKQRLQEIQASAQDTITDRIQEKSSFLSVKPQWGKIFTTGASLLLTTALVGFGGPMFFGLSLVTGFSAIKSFSKSFIQKNIVHNVVSQKLPDDYYLNNVIADVKDVLIAEDINKAIEWANVNSIRSINKPAPKESLIKKSWNWIREHKKEIAMIGAYAGLGTISAFIPAFGALLSLIPITLGMVRESSKDEQSDSRRKNEDLDVWFRRNGIRIIEEVIDKNLDLRTRIGSGIKNAVQKLMMQLEKEKKFKIFRPDEVVKVKGKEYITFDDPDFQNTLKKFGKNPNNYGGMIYAIEVMGELYVGLTERGIHDRLIEHLLTAMRGYTLAKKGVKYPQYRDVHKAIAKGLDDLGWLVEGELKIINEFTLIRDKKGREDYLDSLIENIKPFIKQHVIEIHYGHLRLSEREKTLTKTFPIRRLFEKGLIDPAFYAKKGSPEYLDVKLNGLNMIYGGATGKYRPLPIYDIAIMIALGFQAPKIAGILVNDYNLGYKELKRSVQTKIADILGGSYEAQDNLLRPIIEHLINKEGINRYDVYSVFKHLEQDKYSWFLDWSYSKALLQFEIDTVCRMFNLDPKRGWDSIKPYLDSIERYYAGISEEEWLLIIETKPLYTQVNGKTATNPEIKRLTGLGDTKIKNVFKLLTDKFGFSSIRELRLDLQRKRSIEILKVGYFLKADGRKERLEPDKYFDQIIPAVFSPFDNRISPKRYFEQHLFDGMNIDQVWRKYRLKNDLLAD
ncbi:MAG: hypothetical protein ACXABO_21300 [Promethearchaeota archaeon]